MSKLADKITIVKIQVKAIPSSWNKAAGLVKAKKKALQNHAAKVRNEWGR